MSIIKIARTPPLLAGALKAEAQAELEASDRVAIRCVKAGKPYPPAWASRDEALREIVRAGGGVIPARPAYPPGT